MKILGFGHSHIVALANGCYGLQHDGATVAGRPIAAAAFHYLYGPDFTPLVCGDALNAHILDLLRDAQPDVILLSLGGNEHVGRSIVQSCGPVDFLLGEDLSLPLAEGAAIVMEAGVRAMLRGDLSESFDFLAALRRTTAAPIFCFEPPPPLPDEQVKAYPKEFFRRAVDAELLSPEAFRYKVWRAQSAVYREACAAHDATFVPVPSRFIVPPGVLAREAWGADATHANDAFGGEMIREAFAMMETRMSAAARR
jgi:hypothetical protein